MRLSYSSVGRAAVPASAPHHYLGRGTSALDSNFLQRPDEILFDLMTGFDPLFPATRQWTEVGD
jgi:hypothetical protein